MAPLRDSTPPDPFNSTRWSVVLAAGDGGEAGRAALSTLCETYWLPVYGYVCRRHADRDAALDLTQEFFAQLLERKILSAADPQRGRFRAFLLTALKHFLANDHARAAAQKRGGDRTILSWDATLAEHRVKGRSAALTPDQEFDRQWALALLDRVLHRLAEEQASANKRRQFEVLRECLTGDADRRPRAEQARQLNMSEPAVRTAVSRLRKRYRELLREEIRHTVRSPSEVEDELQRLFEALS